MREVYEVEPIEDEVSFERTRFDGPRKLVFSQVANYADELLGRTESLRRWKHGKTKRDHEDETDAGTASKRAFAPGMGRL